MNRLKPFKPKNKHIEPSTESRKAPGCSPCRPRGTRPFLTSQCPNLRIIPRPRNASQKCPDSLVMCFEFESINDQYKSPNIYIVNISQQIYIYIYSQYKNNGGLVYPIYSQYKSTLVNDAPLYANGKYIK